MIKRDNYLNQLIKTKTTNSKNYNRLKKMRKILSKEVFVGYLKENGTPDSNILIIELDDDKNVMYRNPIELGKYVRSFCKQKRPLCLYR